MFYMFSAKLNFLNVVQIICVVQPMSCVKCKCIILKLKHLCFFLAYLNICFCCACSSICVCCAFVFKWGDGEMQGLLQIVRRDKLLVPKFDYSSSIQVFKNVVLSNLKCLLMHTCEP